MTHQWLLLIPEEREHHPRSVDTSAYSAGEGMESTRDGKGALAIFTPSEKGDAGPSYIGPAPRRRKWQQWRAWWRHYFGG